MTPLQIIFIIVAVITLFAAIKVVSSRNLVHAALWLILVLFGIAVFFVILSAGFFAVAQVVIYIGAIAILMIFTIMLTRRVARDSGAQHNSNWWAAAVLSLLLFAGLSWMLSRWQGFQSTAQPMLESADPLRQLGEGLVAPGGYLIPFEVASILLVAALIGAITVAWERK